MDDLLAFVRAQMDEDERVALAARGDGCSRGDWLVERPGFGAAIRTDDGDVVVYDEGAPSESQVEHIARWDPARVLAEVEAKRRILGEHRPVEADDVPGLAMCFVDNEAMPCDHVRWLAQPHAGQPGWREEWSTEPNRA
jgi:hypothetical protein